MPASCHDCKSSNLCTSARFGLCHNGVMSRKFAIPKLRLTTVQSLFTSIIVGADCGRLSKPASKPANVVAASDPVCNKPLIGSESVSNPPSLKCCS